MTEGGESDRRLFSADCTKHQGASFYLPAASATPRADVELLKERFEAFLQQQLSLSLPLLVYFREITLGTIKLADHVDRLQPPMTIFVGELESPTETMAY